MAVRILCSYCFARFAARTCEELVALTRAWTFIPRPEKTRVRVRVGVRVRVKVKVRVRVRVRG